MFGVFGLPRMGVGGAAMATLAAVVIGTLWLLAPSS
jgi:Na+-driven multidrug efflux pump